MMPSTAIQPPLFPLQEMERIESHLIEVASRGECSGVRVEREAELVEEVLQAHLHGLSQRAIARATGLSRMTVAGILDRAERSGRIRPWKERVARRLMRAVEAGAEQMCEAVEQGLVPASQLSVPLAIMIDKSLLLSGEATSRHEVVGRREIEASEVEADLAELRRTAIPVAAQVVPATPKEGGPAGELASVVAYTTDSADGKA